LEEIIGQKRALGAIEFGIGIHHLSIMSRCSPKSIIVKVTPILVTGGIVNILHINKDGHFLGPILLHINNSI